MAMKKLTAVLAALLVAAAMLPAQGRFAGGLGRGPGPGFGPMAGRFESESQVTGAPYSGVRTTLVQQTLSNGNQIARQEQAKVCRDSQGRVRIEQVLTPEQREKFARLLQEQKRP